MEKRQIKLSMKQLVPTDIDEYIAEHKAGDEVTGRIVDASGSQVLVELGEGIRALCASAAPAAPAAKAAATPKTAAKVDLSNLSSMLKARWKGDAPDPKAAPEALAEGQIRTFKITKIDAEAKRIEVKTA
jgi:small subunit ribosomal protein S1